MPIVVTHNFVSAKPDGPDPDKVSATQWNEDHVVTGDVGSLDVRANDSTIVSGASSIQFIGTNIHVVVDGSDAGMANVTVDEAAGSANSQISLPAGLGDGWFPGQCCNVTPANGRAQGSNNDYAEEDAYVVGIVALEQTGSDVVVTVCVGGPLTQVASTWTNVIAEGGTLLRGSYYYLADSGSGTGFITAVKPTTTGQFVTVVGYAISTTVMIVRPLPPVVVP